MTTIDVNYQKKINNAPATNEASGVSSDTYINSAFEGTTQNDTETSLQAQSNPQTSQTGVNNKPVKTTEELLKKFDNQFKKLGLDLSKEEKLELLKNLVHAESVEQLLNLGENSYTDLVNKMTQIKAELEKSHKEVNVQNVLSKAAEMAENQTDEKAQTISSTFNKKYSIEEWIDKNFIKEGEKKWADMTDDEKVEKLKEAFNRDDIKKTAKTQLNTFVNKFAASSSEDQRLMLRAVESLESLNSKHKAELFKLWQTSRLTQTQRTIEMSEDVKNHNIEPFNITGNMSPEDAGEVSYIIASSLDTDATQVYDNELQQQREEILTINQKLKNGEELTTEEKNKIYNLSIDTVYDYLQKIQDPEKLAKFEPIYKAFKEGKALTDEEKNYLNTLQFEMKLQNLISTESASYVAYSQNQNLDTDFREELVTNNLAKDAEYGEEFYREVLGSVHNFVQDNQEEFNLNEENITSFMNGASGNNYDIVVNDIVNNNPEPTALNPQPTEYQESCATASYIPSSASQQDGQSTVLVTGEDNNGAPQYVPTSTYSSTISSASTVTTNPLACSANNPADNTNNDKNKFANGILSLVNYCIQYVQETSERVITNTNETPEVRDIDVTSPEVKAKNETDNTENTDNLESVIAKGNKKDVERYIFQDPQKALKEYCDNPSKFGPDILDYICECIKTCPEQEQKEIVKGISNINILSQIESYLKDNTVISLAQNTYQTTAGSVREAIQERAEEIRRENPQKNFSLMG